MASIKDVAARAGVAPSTVSRVLSNKGYIKEETAQLVLSAAKELNYRPNFLAKSLKEGKSQTIALIVPNLQKHIYPEIIDGIENVARQKGYSVVLCCTNDDTALEKEYIQKMQNRWVDGFILGTAMADSQHILDLYRSGFPVVLIARHTNDDIDAVAVDNYEAAFMAVEYLIKAGNKKIGIYADWLEVNLFQDRYRGYLDAMAKHGLPVDPRYVLTGTMDDESLYFQMKKIIQNYGKPDAMFASSDPKAIVIIKAILDCGLKIPDDVAVIGFDNIKLSSIITPSLTTVSQPFYKMGEIAMQKLCKQIAASENGEEYVPSIDILDVELIIRKSTQ